MTFYRYRSLIMSPYFLNGTAIFRAIDCAMDLGFKLNCNLDPSAHIEYVCCKAFKTLGIITRLAKDFWLELSLKALFCALVRPFWSMGLYSRILILPITQESSSKFNIDYNVLLAFCLKFLV